MNTADPYHVIGCGIAGASIAYHLSERTDAPIVVHERGDIASETTAKSLAFFGFYGDETQHRMKRYAMERYNEFMATPAANPSYHACGLLEVATTPEGDRALARAGAAGASGRGDPDDANTQYLPPDRLTERVVVPSLDVDELEGCLYRPQVGYVSPTELAFEFVARARENGVEFREHTRVTDLETTDGAVTEIVTDSGTEPAEWVVSAAGPWNVEVAALVDLDIPVRHTLAPVLKVEPPSPVEYSVPWVTHEESGFSIRRNTDGTVLMTHHPVGGYETDATEYDPDAVGDAVPDPIRTEALELLRRLFPEMAEGTVVDEWVGIRSSTPDTNPIVGWTDVEGFSLTAFSTSGIQLSPAAGRIVATQLVDGSPTSYYDGVSITRFDGHTDWTTGPGR